MAEPIVRLKVDSDEFDNRIKRAVSNLTDFEESVRKAGQSFVNADAETVEYIRSLGEMDTVSKNTKQQLREMSNALMELTKLYQNMSEAEKQSASGQALSSSIATLTVRAGEAKDAMDDVAASIKNAASDTRAFDQAAGGITLMTSGFQTCQGAAKLLGANIGDNVEVLAKLQAAMSVTNGLQQIQTLLQKESAVMQGVLAVKEKALATAKALSTKHTAAATVAQKAFNLVAKANPYVLLASAVAAVGTALVAFASSADNAKKKEEELNFELEKTRNQLDQIDKDTDFSVGIAEAAGKSWEYIHALRLEAVNAKLALADLNFDKLLTEHASGEQLDEAMRMQKEAWDDVMKVMNEGTIHEVKKRFGGGNTNKTRGSSGARAGGNGNRPATPGSIEAQARIVDDFQQKWRNAATDELRNKWKAEYEKAKTVLDAMEGKAVAKGSMADLEQELNRLSDAQRLVTTPDEWKKLGGEIDVVKKKMADLRGETQEMETGLSGASENNISAWISAQSASMGNMEMGSAGYLATKANIIDAKTMQNVIESAIANDITISPDTIESLWEQIIGGENIPDSVWQGLMDTINDQLAEMQIAPITIDFNTGNVSKQSKTMKKEWEQAASAIQQVGSAMSSIENPMAKVVGTIAQAVASIALGAGQAIAQAGNGSAGGPWGWIAFAAAATATMISSIASVKSATSGFAEGGIVSGHHFSNDQIPIMANAGEIVLNRAQQGNLASQLESSGSAGEAHPYVTGEMIYLGLTNYLKRRGLGEIVTSK